MNSGNPQLSATHPGTPHLSEEALNDLLIGIGSPDAEEHLASCETCRNRVAGFHSDLALFNRTTLAWSESKAKPIPAQAARRPGRFSPTRPLIWSAATAALLFAALATWNYQHAPATANPPAEFADSPAQIDDDNQLLRNVYNALEEQPASPLSEFSLAQGADASSGTPSKARTQ